MGDDDDAKNTPWWVWLLVVLGIVVLAACAFGGYVVYQLSNVDPSNQYRYNGEPL